MSNLKLINVNKIYPNGFQAVFDMNLEVNNGEFVVLVGPSGCGKSTALRMICGLEAITSGELLIGEKLVNKKAPSDRNIAMCFQDYALYGNMTVYENIAFSLTIRKMKRDVIHQRVMEIAKIVDLEDYLNRYPKNLSGGQRQRVSLGRALAKESEVILMDEPLSNLDAQLRQQTRKELVKVQEKMKSTVIYVTHDQIEAMTMADRIVIMNLGVIQQVGTPDEVYYNPKNLFVATFIGLPSMNLIKGIYANGKFKALSNSFEIDLTDKKFAYLKNYEQKEITLGIRPEHIFQEKKHTNDPEFTTIVNFVELLGAEYNLNAKINEELLSVRVQATNIINLNDNLKLSFDLNSLHFFDTKTEQRIEAEVK